MSRPIPIRWTPKNPQKYAGNANDIWARSSWERLVMQWLDMNDSVIHWSSEELIIKYLSPVDNRVHRYFPDFIVKVKKKDGLVATYVLEVKPEHQDKHLLNKIHLHL